MDPLGIPYHQISPKGDHETDQGVARIREQRHDED
jgi:hypothetical protein